ncbi:MAG: hypothetical protein A3J38_03740 [Gammaproteobacteria bacterium RIFCSPHIGHO2_12_FULL_45_9]|nr:MAG: hypothetical protein A3J38_03740 [Gammaproteobacteria bacterium RIFCSPHIGHO2_12_FULL_45_9]
MVEHLLDLSRKNEGYYTYSGLATFAKHLKQFLSQYEIVGRVVTHRTQKASKVVLDAIQSLMVARTQGFTPDLQTKLETYNSEIAELGTAEQQQLHEQTLQNATQYATPESAPAFEVLLEHFKGCVQTAHNAQRFATHTLLGGAVPPPASYAEQQP